jgi:hypothetical protein
VTSPVRARLATSPPSTGSAATANTIGMGGVASFAARAAGPGLDLPDETPDRGKGYHRD